MHTNGYHSFMACHRQRRLRWRSAVLLFAAVLLLARPGRAAEDTARLPDGWKRIVPIPALSVGGAEMLRASTLTLWTEGGWLIARRDTGEGELEWQVVLAHATDAREPEAIVGERIPFLNVRYSGRFIRDFAGRLRVYREPKTDQSPVWPPIALDGEAKILGLCGYGSGGVIRGLKLDDWVWAQAGPSPERPDVLVRLQHAGLDKEGHGFASFITEGQMSYGKAQVTDEGDLLTAHRGTFDSVEKELYAKKLHDELGTGDPPPLAAKEWFNAETPLSLDKLHGKVVLLDFWATWCGPCVEKIPRVEELHRKYADRGLVIIGVHSADRSQKASSFVKDNGITFPVLIDTGETGRRYAVEGVPVYFLIDKTGKLIWGFSHVPPSERQIEELLR